MATAESLLKPFSSFAKCYCGVSFGLFKRKFHCHYCGNVRCADCTEHTFSLPKLGYTEPVKVCNYCYYFLKMNSSSPGDLEKCSVRALKSYCSAYGIEEPILEKSELISLIVSSTRTDVQEAYFRQHAPVEFKATPSRPSNRRGGSDPNHGTSNSTRTQPTSTSESPGESFNFSQLFPNITSEDVDQFFRAMHIPINIQDFQDSNPPPPRQRSSTYSPETASHTRPSNVPTEHKASSSSKSTPVEVLTIRDIIKNGIDPATLSSKTLKLILSHNRVDYKEILEKSELVDRVKTLCANIKKEEELVEKGNDEDLCRICCDAPMNCLILECAHMATCIDCGKLLKECPICRNRISRIVHVFKA